jgi:DNA-binding PadR family transcriptional regulator
MPNPPTDAEALQALKALAAMGGIPTLEEIEPTLERAAERGYLDAIWEDGERKYRLTDKGRALGEQVVRELAHEG